MITPLVTKHCKQRATAIPNKPLVSKAIHDFESFIYDVSSIEHGKPNQFLKHWPSGGSSFLCSLTVHTE